MVWTANGGFSGNKAGFVQAANGLVDGDQVVVAVDPGYLPDGMYYSNFFTGGYAIHGYNLAPDYPASHGCMRTPIVDAVFIYYWLRMNDAVDVYQ